MRTKIFGIINVTPDSFSDGGVFFTKSAAVLQGEKMLQLGVDFIDVGGESTRPGARRVSVEVECARVLPVVKELVALGAAVSVDTMSAQTAFAAISLGAVAINDVSGGKADPNMIKVIANSNVDYILMHWRGHSENMMREAYYKNINCEVLEDLFKQRELFLQAGVAKERIILDPGLGFSKNFSHNWSLLRGLPNFVSRSDSRVLLGASRKRFLADVALDKDAATAAVSFLAAQANVWAVRVHNVSSSLAAVNVAYALGENVL